MKNGKISQFLKDHWRGAVLVIGVAVFCASVLFCCEHGASIHIKKNRISVHKTK